MIVVRGPDELLAALPHLFGFTPTESVVVLPVSGSLPTARVDLPRTAADRDEIMDALAVPYARHAGPNPRVALLCLSEDQGAAELTSQHLAAGFSAIGVSSDIRLWATTERWVDLETGASGLRSNEAESRFAAEAVVAGLARPMTDRAALATSLIGDRTPVASLLPAARQSATDRTISDETNWVLQRTRRFHNDGDRLSDHDAARMLLAVSSTLIRDAVWASLGQDSATSDVALWSDLTRRAPDQVRAPAASLLALASGLKGDGARAWCALDQVPDGPPYRLATLIAAALQAGLHPNEWEQTTAFTRAGETVEPPHPPGPARGLRSDHQDLGRAGRDTPER